MNAKEIKKKQDKCKHDERYPVKSSYSDIRCRKCQAQLKRFWCQRCGRYHERQI